MTVTFSLDRHRLKKRFGQMQNYIDSDCIRLMTPYVPVAKPFWRNAGRLRDSVEISEPGVIVYTAPHSRDDYYAYVNHKAGGNPNAVRLWFEFMKQENSARILNGAAAAGGKK